MVSLWGCEACQQRNGNTKHVFGGAPLIVCNDTAKKWGGGLKKLREQVHVGVALAGRDR